MVPTNPIPREGVLVLTVPTGVTVPSDDVSTFSMICSAGCSTGSGMLSYDSSTRELTIESAFTSFMQASNTLTFSITGWTNPSDTSTYEFALETYFKPSTTLYGIETFSGLEITAESSACYVLTANITLGDNRIYAEPT